MKVLDLFSGLGGWSAAFKDRGHDVTTIDLDYRFNPTYSRDVGQIESLAKFGTFDTVDHQKLLSILSTTIKDPQVMQLIEVILANHKGEISGKGMPIGNLTSQFFANVYMDVLDQYVKHVLKVKHYIRYVDDFVLLHHDKEQLAIWKAQIEIFLREELLLELHPDKSMIVKLQRGVTLLGFRIFPKYRLLKKSNAVRIWRRIEHFKGIGISKLEALTRLAGWIAYAAFADTQKLTERVLARLLLLYKEVAAG